MPTPAGPKSWLTHSEYQVDGMNGEGNVAIAVEIDGSAAVPVLRGDSFADATA
ncbi:hypothetical protein [Nocardia sp. NPDC004860]|uniref:hypothetical protein n=1 Tax=Nocardia sp. NPDC004860 TaxID=3154557 RepID=UPI0033A08386